MPLMIGLDIGRYSIKATLFDGSFGRYSFKGTEEELILDGVTSIKERQRDALQTLLKRVNSDGNNIVSSLPSSKVSVRKLEVPFTDRNKIEIVLPSLIEEQVPFEIEDITIQNRILNIVNDSSEILALIVPTKSIEEHLEYLKHHNINPKHLIVDADALSYYASEGVQAFIDIGASKTICAFFKDGRTLFFRSIPNGVSPPEGMDYSEALASKDDKYLSFLINSIRRTLINFEDKFGLDTDEVIVSGGGINIPNMTDLLREELGVPLQKASLPKGLPSEWALAYALGKKAAGETNGREFDLRVGSFAYQGNLKRVEQLLTMSAIVSILALIGSAGWYVFQYQALKKEITKVEENIATEVALAFPDLPENILSSPSTALSLMQEEVTEAYNKLEKLGSIISDEPPTLTLLKDLSEGMPPHTQARIDVNELIISKTSINIKAETDGFQTATAIETALKKKPLFKQAQKADEKSKRDGIQFSIIIPLVHPEDKNGEGG
jgi:hypothetical protein